MAKTLFGAMFFLILTGCTLMQMQHENEILQARIDKKEGQLEALQQETRRLDEKQRQLAVELKKRTLTLNQLNTELDTLVSQNRQLVAMGKSQRRDMSQVEAEILALESKQKELADLKTQALPSSAKAEKVAQLQEEIRNYLVMGLKSKHRQNLQ
ncbi:hypothetical protein DSCO28_21940 [Desulfosarcina ovata subsp. sediminis]|uniref:Lipoprotein n=1 Tax=Desulfosarcina ovata subsp. sediminis TaxID=885957 RepID=A0A5K7ZHE4_9BACT|nr:hypothetical protein [Desulfosarcina ovata]BBO81628.1 hypothetical protein DSCO28_21940 [Desulfosarcina ovata subsp. sediminis]